MKDMALTFRTWCRFDAFRLLITRFSGGYEIFLVLNVCQL